MPAPPLPPKPTFDEKPRGSWLAVFLTLGLTLSCVIVLTFLTIGYFAPVLVVGGIMGGVIAFHYVVWGWWLQPVLKRAMEEEEAEREG
jgi:hypothetical protein